MSDSPAQGKGKGKGKKGKGKSQSKSNSGKPEPTMKSPPKIQRKKSTWRLTVLLKEYFEFNLLKIHFKTLFIEHLLFAFIFILLYTDIYFIIKYFIIRGGTPQANK